MKKNWKAAFVLITMACILAAGILSCKTEVDNDTVAPADSGDVSITNVKVPNATLAYAGQSLPVTITGLNFTGTEVTTASFTFSGAVATATDVKIVNDTKATAVILCPYDAGSLTVVKTLTVTYGSSNKSGNFTLYASSDIPYAVGDIVLSDGTKVAVADVSSITAEQAGKAVAVICSTLYGGGTVLGVGLKQSSLLSWAPSGTTGYTTNFTDIVCTPSAAGSGAGSGGAASTATFTGDTDGSDNWDVVCSVDPTGTASDVMATNYPAFNYAVNYGTTNSLPTNYTDGWYMPSIAELCAVYKNKEAINTSITAINEVPSGSATAITSSFYYWSSSQWGSYCEYAWTVLFGSDYVVISYKNNLSASGYVLVVRAF